MNYYDFGRMGQDRTARFHREAAVGAIARASATPRIAVTAARVLRRLAEQLDQSQRRASSPQVEVAQPTLMLALTEA